jgi:hypothetical protein
VKNNLYLFRKVRDWWLSWEESEETAIANFKNEVLKLDLSNELSSLLINNPENVKGMKKCFNELHYY